MSSTDFRLPRTRLPEPLMRGVRGWKTKDHYLILRVHYSADPEADLDWREERVKGYRGGFDGADWQREMEIDFGSYAGTPVYPAFDFNKSVKPVRYNPTLPLWRGWDFGYRHPAVVFLQLWPDDTLVFLHEIFPTLDKESLPGISTGDLCKLVIQETDRLFPNSLDNVGVYDFCDPSGNQKKETSDFSSMEILQQHGIDPEWASVGRKNRIEYLRIYIEGTRKEDKPKFLINPHCALGIEAFKAAYRYPDHSSGSADREMPDLSKKVQDDPYIHIMDATEYVAACNLEVTFPTRTGFRKEDTDESLVTDLASAYLGNPGNATDRIARTPLAATKETDNLEMQLQELIGVDSLSDAMELY